MHPPTHLVPFFCVTAGQNGENLGSDEEQVVLIAYLVYDLKANKVLSVHHHHVQPINMQQQVQQHDLQQQQQLLLSQQQQLTPHSQQQPFQPLTQQQRQQIIPQQHTQQYTQQQQLEEYILTEECKIQTGLNEDEIKTALTLDQVLIEIEKQLQSAATAACHVSFITDGALHLRMCLIPESTTKEIPLSDLYFRYYDLRKEVKKFTKVNEPINCLNDILDLLEIEKADGEIYGVKQCSAIVRVLEKLTSCGHVFHEPELIKDKLEPGVCNHDDEVEEDTVVRARGLPWQSSDIDIATFFRGLNVQKGGVALCLSAQGRRNGEALIRFEAKEYRDLALRKHKHHIGPRYIEVYKATGEDFISVAGGSSIEAHVFLSRQSDGGCGIIIRMRGLPYVCNAQQVLDFFDQEPNPVKVLDGEEGVLFVHQGDGRATGDAFVLFATEEEASLALAKHRQCIGTRYIELFKSTTAEVQQVLNRSLDPRASVASSGMECGDTSFLPSIITFPILQPSFLPPQQMIASGVKKDCVRIRNLPLETQVGEILSFLGEHSKHIVYKGVHLVFNSRGVPSGEAFIQMDSEFSAQVTAGARNNKLLYTSASKKHYIEVFQCSGDEMNMLLSNGLQQVRFPSNTQSTFTVLAGPTNGQTLFFPTHLSPPPLISAPIGRQMITAPNPNDNMEVNLLYNHNTNQGSSLTTYQQLPPSSITLTHPPPSFTHPPIQPIQNQQLSTMHPNQQLIQSQPNQAPFSPFQPLFYWYPTAAATISPQETFYLPILPTTVLIKGLPPNVQPHDILSFLEGQYEMAPDVQMVRTADARSTGDAYITFANRNDAERAINRHVGKTVGNRVVEMYIV